MAFHQLLGDALGMIDHARRPAMAGGRDGDADRHLLLFLCVGKAGDDGKGRDRQAE
jgi:hypothetical protein